MLAQFGPERVRAEVILAPYTTFKVGGPAEWFFEARTSAEIVDALRPRTRTSLLRLLAADRMRWSAIAASGVVIRPRGVAGRDRRQRVADAATTINGLVRWTVQRGIAGLEAWAGTPGTVGGAIFGNAHFAGRLIGDLVESVRLAGLDGEARDLSRDQMEFGYDRSRLQKTREVLLSAVFRVSTGDPAALREVARQSLDRKKTQPLDTPSAGCIFQNPDRTDVPADIPASAGALVDRAGLKGAARGDARVSPTHGNVIVNVGHATASEIRALIDRGRARVAERFDVALQEEMSTRDFDVDPVDRRRAPHLRKDRG
jgi:UDP-N-acetylmuramate dehydrogenase